MLSDRPLLYLTCVDLFVVVSTFLCYQGQGCLSKTRLDIMVTLFFNWPLWRHSCFKNTSCVVLKFLQYVYIFVSVTVKIKMKMHRL